MDENASQSILMVGGMLLAIALLSFFVYAIATFGGFARDMNAQIEGSEIQKFNQHFSQYDGRFNLTIQDVVTAINFAKDWNDKNNYTYNQVVNQSVEFSTKVFIIKDGTTTDVFAEIGSTNYANNQKFKDEINKKLNDSSFSDYYYAVNTTRITGTEISNGIVLLNGEYGSGDIEIDARTGFVRAIYFTLLDLPEFNIRPDRIEYIVRNRDHFRMTEIR